MIQVCHQVPGRLRLRVAALRTDPARGAGLATALARQPGILAVRTNPACASLIVHYRSATVDPPRILDWLGCLARGAPLAALPALPASRTGLRAWSQRLMHRLTKGLAQGPIPVRRGGLRRWPDARQRPLAGAPAPPAGWHWSRPPQLPAPVATPPPLLARLQWRLTRWMLRGSLQCLWFDLRHRPTGNRLTTAIAAARPG
ncbi:MAG: hypothetical protein EA400_17210 [Chromatiaceae bacterium]|nr:MAG: hypothetical protein EA400_17210 [Chromatiaceae bacterium]